MTDCMYQGCTKPASTKGMCSGHYAQMRKYGVLRPLQGQGGRRKVEKNFSTIRVCQRCAFEGDWKLFTTPPQGSTLVECRECYRNRLSEAARTPVDESENNERWNTLLHFIDAQLEGNASEPTQVQ